MLGIVGHDTKAPWGQKSRYEAGRRRRRETHQRDRHRLPLLETLPDIANRTVTADALLTQRALASYLLDRGADYLFTVKGNQPTLLSDIQLLLDEDIAGRAPDFADESPKPEHGRRERRSIWISGELTGYLDLPGAGQENQNEFAVTNTLCHLTLTPFVDGIVNQTQHDSFWIQRQRGTSIFLGREPRTIS